MLTTDLSLIEDSAYKIISKNSIKTLKLLKWLLLRHGLNTHRDMGPKSTYLGPEIPEEEFNWQDHTIKRL